VPQEQVHATPAVRTYPRPSSQEMEQLASDDTTDERDSAEEILDETDELLDSIDELLEDNALEVLRAYVQRGGQAVRVFLDTATRGFGATWRSPWADQRST
jgi:ubiquitin-like protein Pup